MTLKKITLVFTMVTIAALFITAGCGKDEPAKTDTPEVNMDKMDHTAMEAEKAVGDAKAVVDSIEQTTCPIMGKPIDKSLFTEYKGKKVYFCCPGCKEPFEKDPEKYITKLPQFKTAE